MKTDMLNKNLKMLLSYTVLILVAAIAALPFIWMLITSFKDITKVFDFPPQLIPKPFEAENYIKIFKVQPFFPLYYFNSLYIALLVTAGTCIVAALAGYSFAKIKFPGKEFFFILLLSSMMIPVEATAIPLFKWMSALKLTNTHFPLIVPAILGPSGVFGVFMMRQFFHTIPYEINEAAKIDGCSQPKVFGHIMLPMSIPALSTLSILTFLNRWNEFFEPLIYLSSSKLYTLPLALSMFTDQSGTQWNLVMVASVLATVPLLIIFFFGQKLFIESIALTGLK